VPRPKAFDPRRALDSALHCFKQHGFNGASLATLTQEMGVGRASLYATYGDKRTLFMRALADYADATFGFFRLRLDTAADPLAEIRAILRDIAAFSVCDDGRFGCFLVNSAAELAATDEEVRAFVARSFERMEDGFASALERARAEGRLAADKDPVALGRFLFATIVGIRVMGKARADVTVLNDVVDSALACLERP
jgi:TetR/AcrR family transcriptional regulator, transcriptional repressor for nem operon